MLSAQLLSQNIHKALILYSIPRSLVPLTIYLHAPPASTTIPFISCNLYYSNMELFCAIMLNQNDNFTNDGLESSYVRSGLKLQTSAETNGDEYIRVGIVQETSTYECLEVRRRVHTTGDEYIRAPRSQETSIYECLEARRRVNTTGNEYIRVPKGQETSTYDKRRVHTSTYK